MPVTRVQFGTVQIDVDIDATRAAYAALEVPPYTDCTCADCRNFAAQISSAITNDFESLLAPLGIDPSLPTEVTHLCREPGGSHRYAIAWACLGELVGSRSEVRVWPDGSSIQLHHPMYAKFPEDREFTLVQNGVPHPPRDRFPKPYVVVELTTTVPKWVVSDPESP